MGRIRKVALALSAVENETLQRFPKYAEAARLWGITAELEAAPNPTRHAINTLHTRVPKFLLFDQAARQLESSYQMSALSTAVPPALQALLEVAVLRIADVLSAINRGARDDLTTLERRANRSLEAAFKEAWRQSGVTVALRLSTDLLEIQIVNEDERYTRLAERSDGLRQFVALHAFIAQAHADAPILLIDEAEQRLHYDAQADLVQMLARQRLASKIIYTTHSAGCLPEDLGHGVRLVEPVEGDEAASRVVNKFWGKSGRGFSPLLFGLGATTLAFFPTRRAVCVEGPSDMLLLPTMFREALATATLGYQFVPGLSSAARSLAPVVPNQASNVSYLVDGDDAGRTMAADLTAGGVPAGRTFILASPEGEAIETEDFIDGNLLFEAADRLIRKHLPHAKAVSRADISAKHRMKGLRKAYLAATGREVDKVELTYEILEGLDRDPLAKLCEKTREADLASIASAIAESFA